MGLFDIYLITDEQLMENQVVINTYFYQQTSIGGGGTGAEAMYDAYVGQVLPSVLDIQESDSVLHTGIRVVNLFDGGDLWDAVISEAGNGAFGSEPLPTFNAVGFRLQQDNGDVKNGAKRYAGMDEAVQDRGVIDSGGYAAVLDILADVLFDTLLDGIVPSYVPIIVKRILDAGVYRLPANLGEAEFGNVVEADWNPLVSSQVSRKVGVGI